MTLKRNAVCLTIFLFAYLSGVNATLYANENHSEELQVLLRLLREGNRESKLKAIQELGKKGDAIAVSPLIDSLKDPDIKVRSSAVYSLGQIGDSSAVGVLIRSLRDPEIEIRGAAALSLGMIGDSRAIPSLLVSINIKQNQKIILTIETSLMLIGIIALDEEAMGKAKNLLAGEPVYANWTQFQLLILNQFNKLRDLQNDMPDKNRVITELIQFLESELARDHNYSIEVAYYIFDTIRLLSSAPNVTI